LNEQTDIDVWLVRVSAIRIGDSDPAPQFTVVAGPEISKQIRKVKQAGSGDRVRREAAEFWEAWLPIASDRVEGITLPKRGPSSVFFSRRLIPGLPLNFHGWTTSTEAYAEIRIQDESEDVNDAIFDAFLARRGEIEAAYGGPLVWGRMEGHRGAKIDTERVAIGSRADPTEEGLVELANVSNRLIEAIKPLAESTVADGQAGAASHGDEVM
jgi:hypothetical protein